MEDFAQKEAGGVPSLRRRRIPLRSLLRVLVHAQPAVAPVVDGLVPELGVLGFEDPVALVGEVEHSAWHTEELERGEELQAFGDVEAHIALGVDDERGRVGVLDGEHRRPLAEGIFADGLVVEVPRMRGVVLFDDGGGVRVPHP